MTDPQLLEYIRLQKAEGADNDTIKQSLLSGGGWNSSDVDEAFSAVASGDENSAKSDVAVPAP